MKGVDSHGCCKNYCENRITASAYMPDNDTTGGYVLHMAVGNGISYPVGDHLHYSSFRVWIRTGDRQYCDQIFNSGAETEEFFYRLGLRDGMKLRKNVKMVLKQLSE